MSGVELDLDSQITYIDAFLMFEPVEMLVLNPYIGDSNGSILKEIRKSLVELKTLKEGKQQ